jgi:redox-sensing transcriptional repressor
MNDKEKKNSKRISDATIRRLSVYYRILNVLECNGIKMVSSNGLGAPEGISGNKVRKDLSNFGSFGERGTGYAVSSLKMNIAKILGIDRKWNIVLVGAVQFSTVLINSDIFKRRNFYITKIFDETREQIGRKINDITVSDMNNLEKEIDPYTDDLAIVAVAPPEVQSVIARLGRLGLKGILYFAARPINVPENIVVRNQDISIELGTITYHITNNS